MSAGGGSADVWGGRRRGVLTLADLALLLDVPGVQRGSLLVLHGRALVEVLREVRLVEPGGLHHLPLGQVVLLHVALHHLRHLPGVPPVRQRQHPDAQVHFHPSHQSHRFLTEGERLSVSQPDSESARTEAESHLLTQGDKSKAHGGKVQHAQVAGGEKKRVKGL